MTETSTLVACQRDKGKLIRVTFTCTCFSTDDDSWSHISRLPTEDFPLLQKHQFLLDGQTFTPIPNIELRLGLADSRLACRVTPPGATGSGLSNHKYSNIPFLQAYFSYDPFLFKLSDPDSWISIAVKREKTQIRQYTRFIIRDMQR